MSYSPYKKEITLKNSILTRIIVIPTAILMFPLALILTVLMELGRGVWNALGEGVEESCVFGWYVFNEACYIAFTGYSYVENKIDMMKREKKEQRLNKLTYDDTWYHIEIGHNNNVLIKSKKPYINMALSRK